jgi:hypothetical protein
MIGRTPWNFGKTGHLTSEQRNNLSKAHKGKWSGHGFSKGIIPHNYAGGITYKHDGYKMILNKNHPNSGKFKYVKNSRLVVEKHIGRILKRNEIVHHINENKTDDRIENLMCFSSHSAHGKHHFHPDRVKQEEIIFDGSKL